MNKRNGCKGSIRSQKKSRTKETISGYRYLGSDNKGGFMSLGSPTSNGPTQQQQESNATTTTNLLLLLLLFLFLSLAVFATSRR
jgi:hypothetical protein